MVADLIGVTPEQVTVGMPLEVEWIDVDGFSLPQFRPATPERRPETRTIGEMSEQVSLPTWVLNVTTTHIVSGALATRDFLDVHHDRAAAVRKGSQDIFLNINTSLGYMQRYVSDWIGPEAVITALRVRLGAPAYAGSLLTFTGSVQSVDPATGQVIVAVQATNDLGPHITGTVELELP
jgi:hypothetical protein